MTKKEIKEFSLRIAESSKTELIVITYDIILNYIETAQESYNNSNLEDVVFNLQKAKQFVNNLSSCLDFRYSIAHDLLRLYIYINNCLLKDIIKREPQNADNIKGIISKLRESYQEISPLDKSGKVMKNSEQVYVGYTYGKTSTLNEVVIR